MLRPILKGRIRNVLWKSVSYAAIYGALLLRQWFSRRNLKNIEKWTNLYWNKSAYKDYWSSSEVWSYRTFKNPTTLTGRAPLWFWHVQIVSFLRHAVSETRCLFPKNYLYCWFYKLVYSSLLKYFSDQIISASSGDLGANDWLKIFQKYIFNFVKIQKKYKFDWILSKFPIF